jgi:hypothetical protein
MPRRENPRSRRPRDAGHPCPSGKLADFEGHPGAYGQVGTGWLVCLPTGELCSLNAGHTITEHADGTITVSPSILMPADRGAYWHGYLEAGIWREV